MASVCVFASRSLSHRCWPFGCQTCSDQMLMKRQSFCRNTHTSAREKTTTAAEGDCSRLRHLCFVSFPFLIPSPILLFFVLYSVYLILRTAHSQTGDDATVAINPKLSQPSRQGYHSQIVPLAVVHINVVVCLPGCLTVCLSAWPSICLFFFFASSFLFAASSKSPCASKQLVLQSFGWMCGRCQLHTHQQWNGLSFASTHQRCARPHATFCNRMNPMW